ncbi:MAG TPA: ATP-binding protein [Tepidisphaeraceae bacterium]|nr:ATP-binding protein [Tepidisphaeraceae bacterium]
MAVSWDTFEHFKQRGLDARRAGQWDSARVYLLEAARAMVELSKQTTDQQLQEARTATSSRLLELARDCESEKNTKRKPFSARPPSGDASLPESDDKSDTKNWIVREKPTIRFEDVAGLDDVKEDIRLRMLYPFEHPQLAEKFGISAGGGILLYGPPGTGKTMLAKATAGEIDATFFRVSPADLLSKWFGQAEQNIQELFNAAAAERRSIIFIDEIESLVPARRDEGSSAMQRVVPQILQGMEGFDKKNGSPILFMGTTNVPWQLDPAVLRPGRFDEKVYIPLPDLPARRKILDIYLAHRPVAEDVDFDKLAIALEGFSGADIKHICDRAATVPFLKSIASGVDGEITMDILKGTFAETHRSVTREMLQRFEQWAAAVRQA